MEPDWERTASDKLKRYGYVVISCANFSSALRYSEKRTIYPNFIELEAQKHRPVAAKKLELRQHRGVLLRVLGTLDLDLNEDITQDRFKIIPRFSHTGQRLDILVLCGWWESNRFWEDYTQKMEVESLLKWTFVNPNLLLSEYSIDPRTNRYQEVQLDTLPGEVLEEDMQEESQWTNHDDGIFCPEDFLLLKAQRDGYRGVLAIPVISTLVGTERVMSPDVSRFEVLSEMHSDEATALKGTY
jgi:hypothetical protein